MLAFHGTSIQNAESIWKNGFDINAPKNWQLSPSNKIFCLLDTGGSESFQYTLTQATLSAFREIDIVKRAVIVIDITGIKYAPDSTNTMPKHMTSIEMKHIPHNRVKAVFADVNNLVQYKLLFYFQVVSKNLKTTLNISLTEDEIKETSCKMETGQCIFTDIEKIYSRNIFYKLPQAKYYL
jgi:hypothetical protein